MVTGLSLSHCEWADKHLVMCMNEDAQFETTLYPQVNFEVFEDPSCPYCSWVNVWCHSTACKPYLLPL